MQKYSISVSGLMAFAETPKHFHEWFILKKREPSPAMVEGSAFHKAVLEPELFNETYYVNTEPPAGMTLVSTVDEIKAALDEGKVKPEPKIKKPELIELFLTHKKENEVLQKYILPKEIDELYAEREQLSESQMDRILNMRDSVFENKWASRFIGAPDAEVEKPLFGEIEGVEIRARLDWYLFHKPMDRYVLLDLKKTTSAKRRVWESKVYQLKYFLQAWLYSELIRQNFGKDTLYAYVTTEGASPYITEIYAADDGQLDAGEELARKKLNDFKRCLDNDEWPGYSDGSVQPCSLPHYAFDQIAEEVDNAGRD